MTAAYTEYTVTKKYLYVKIMKHLADLHSVPYVKDMDTSVEVPLCNKVDASYYAKIDSLYWRNSPQNLCVDISGISKVRIYYDSEDVAVVLHGMSNLRVMTSLSDQVVS